MTLNSESTERTISSTEEPAPGQQATSRPMSSNKETSSSLAAIQSLSIKEIPNRFTVSSRTSLFSGSRNSITCASVRPQARVAGTEAMDSGMCMATSSSPFSLMARQWSSPMRPAPGESITTASAGSLSDTSPRPSADL